MRSGKAPLQKSSNGVLDAAAVLHVAPDAIVGADDTRRIVIFNQEAERLFGYSRDEVIGQPLDILLPEHAANAHRDWDNALAGSQDGARPMGRTARIMGRRKDGEIFPGEVRISALSENGHQTFLASVRDVTDRVKAEAQLRKWQNIFEHAPWGVAIVSPHGACLEMMNSAFAEMHGYNTRELIGMPIGVVCAADEQDDLLERLQIAGTLRGSSFETTNLRKDGSLFPAVIDTSTVQDESGRPLYQIVNIRDISERKAVEEALLESEERYRSIVTAMQEGIVLQDRDNRVQMCNASAERILGLTAEQLLGVTSFDPRWQATDEDGKPVPSENHPAVVALRTGRPQSNVVMGVHKADGGVAWLSVNSQPLFRPGEPTPYGVITSFMDITDHRRAEQAVAEQEALLRKVLQLMPVGVWIIDREGRIIFGNEAGQQIWAGAKYVGLDLFGEYKAWYAETGEPVDPEAWAAARAISCGDSTIDEILRIQCFDGSFKTIYNSAIPIRDANGNIAWAISINQDITERVEAYQMLEQRVKERTSELSALLEVSRQVASKLELAPLFETILGQLRTVVDYTGAAIGIVEGDTLRLYEYQGPVPRDHMLQLSISPEHDTGYGRVVEHRVPVIIDDIWDDTPWLRSMQSLTDDAFKAPLRQIHSWMGVPLVFKDKVLGVLRLDHNDPHHFTEEHARLVLAFADQAAVAIQNARLYEQAQQVAALEERQRLARELHDSLSQGLYGIVLGARTARALLNHDPESAREPLDYVLSMAEASFTEMRALIFELRPESLEQEGLVAALNKRVEVLSARYGIDVHTDLCGEPALSLAAKTALYRIAQEALHNIAKHAHARRIDLRLAFENSIITLVVQDDGRGFDTTRSYPGRLGLRSMLERTESMGGKLTISSSPARGTTITAVVPVPQSVDAA